MPSAKLAFSVGLLFISILLKQKKEWMLHNTGKYCKRTCFSRLNLSSFSKAVIQLAHCVKRTKLLIEKVWYYQFVVVKCHFINLKNLQQICIKEWAIITLEQHAKAVAYYHNRLKVVTVRSDSQNLSHKKFYTCSSNVF